MALAIICSGGDTSGMNPAIKQFVDYLHHKNQKSFLIYDGLEGLIDGNIKEASCDEVAGILHRGGTIIRSSRSKRFYEYKYRLQAFENLKSFGITGIIVLGGDGSFRAFNQFSLEFEISFIGIPSTIDNDIYGTEYCLGVDTALNVICDSLDKIRDTASSFNRAFIVEIMGRNCGYLTAQSAIVSGAELCVISEIEFDFINQKKRLKKEISDGRKYILALVSEGSNKTSEIYNWIEDELEFETRVTILGHLQRGGSPSVYDRLMAFDFTILAIDYLLENKKSNQIVVYNKGIFSFIDIDIVVKNSYKLDNKLLSRLEYLN